MPLGRRRRPTDPTADGAADVQRTAYAAVPYPSEPFAQTHPRRMAVEARLFGLDPAPVERCRILELGCADGGNLIGIAESLPGAHAVGIDLSAEAIARGREVAPAAGVANVDLQVADLAMIDPRELGRFDYVIAHGVYSWVPADVRDRLLALVADCLADHGVAFVSFNLLPGGHLRALVRDVLQLRTRGVDDAQERLALARRELDRLARSTKTGGGRLGEYLGRLRGQPDALLFHDELAPVNDPVRLRDFAAHAGRHGLQWLTEARLGDSAFGSHDPAVAEQLEDDGADRITREEALDVAGLRMFRQALLALAKRRAGEAPDPRALRHLFVSGRVLAPRRPGAGVERFRHPDGGEIATDHEAIKAVLRRIGAAWPRALAVADLTGDDDAVAAALLSAYAANLVTLEAQAPPVAGTPGERPRCTALARTQAERGGTLTTLRHEAVHLEDELSRRLVALLDGTRDRAQLASELGLGGKRERELGAVLDRLAEHGLLVASDG